MFSLKSFLTYCSLIVSSGFAVFSMFFGSGNLVFPLNIGRLSGDGYAYATLGLMLTGVLLPFLGLFVIFLHRGSYVTFFQKVDKRLAFLLPTVILSLMGPFAVMPRCVTVSFASFSQLSTHLSLWQFSLIMCGLIYLFSFDKGKVIPLLGNVLTPILLFSLSLIIYCGVVEAPALKEGLGKGDALLTGIEEGYQTMDMLASFFFASTVITYLRKTLNRRVPCPLKRRNSILFSLVLGALFLALVYGFLVYLGAAYAEELAHIPTEQSLTYIAYQTLGHVAGPIVATSVTLACLTTAIILASVVSDFYYDKIFQKKVPLYGVNLGVLLITFFISTLEFSGIAAYLKPILTFLYPGVIVMTCIAIGHKVFGWPYLRWGIYVVFAGTLVRMVLL